ncbi:8-oxoguanine deaminase [Rosenbergiella australiborealis]|uniref:8-oxoguanine deaminase n=1 Tax=Rosenbergiella australiborealis TaxID=1544696 RepID=A0ABS5TAG9_9GAMM|nr:8-oxoguanine deaminase [Rosenbergiella australiborealis]MBT0728505.1 8-oxoguanine deaminase [Rosenbergiella australiborealis]
MTNRVWIKQPLACFDGTEQIVTNGIVVEAGKIIEVLAPHQSPSSPCDTIFDARQHVVLPGLINTHHHFYQTLTRAWGPVVNQPLFPWLKTLYPIWAKLTPKALRLGSEVALAELLLSGCTTTSDHHYLFPNGMEDAIDIQVSAVNHLGMRATLSRGSMSLGEKSGGLPPEQTVQAAEVILQDSLRLIDRYHDADDGAMINIALAPCSPFSVTPEIMQESAKMAKEKNVRLHTHLAETLDEETFCLERFGLRTVDYLESVGWLNHRTWLAHGIHFNDEEIARLGKEGVAISHCPVSNMRLASGICRTKELSDAGAIISLGVDGSASNDASNMMYEARQALYLQRLRYGTQTITPEVVLGWATRGGAKTLGRGDIGEIKVGKQADFALFTLEDIRFSGSHDPLAALLLCGAERADRVMVAGNWRVVNGEIVNMDLHALLNQHRTAAKKLVNL